MGVGDSYLCVGSGFFCGEYNVEVKAAFKVLYINLAILKIVADKRDFLFFYIREDLKLFVSISK